MSCIVWCSISLYVISGLQVTAYYVRCAKTNNHTVREAACQCIAELFMKIDRSAVRPQLAKLQRTLRRCLKDDSWTVSLYFRVLGHVESRS